VILKEKTHCEVCDNKNLSSVMNLGRLPLPDDLRKIGDPEMAPKFPTEVLFCDTCKTAHLRWVAPNHVVFPAEYHYRGANTKDVLIGMEGLVDTVEKRNGPLAGLKVLDIGCNDGSLLNAFRKRGAITTGIEPTDAADEAAAQGHAIDKAYLDYPEAYRYVKTYGVPDLITFVNVFAHIENFGELLGSVNVIRGLETNPDIVVPRPTRIVIENHYLGSVLDRNQFDTFYHEHPRTYSFASFAHIAKKLGMHIEWVEFPARYGGNIRVCLAPNDAPWPTRRADLVLENNFKGRLVELDARVHNWRWNMRDWLSGCAPIPAAAMPGRATILFNLLGFDSPKWITGVYEVPRSKKIGHYVPGTTIPIVSDAEFPWDTYTGPVLNMAWHIPLEIYENWRAKGFKGELIPAIGEL
jgi:SAM-dependent methyltransferase